MVGEALVGGSLRATLMGGGRILGFFLLISLAALGSVVARLCRVRDRHLVSKLLYTALNRMIGLRVRVHGALTDVRPAVFVANHISYLDVLALGSFMPATFVAKSEVATWPVIGPMARILGTLFIERRREKADAQRVILEDKLRQGESLIFFPEGTSSDGQRVLPFKSSLFSIVDTASAASIPVQPLTIGCTELGGLPMGHAWRPYYAWFGDMTLLPHLWNVFRIGHFTVDVVFHPPVLARDVGGRKALAAHCERAIAAGLERLLKAPSSPPRKKHVPAPSALPSRAAPPEASRDSA